jgi:hypothetical protein
MQNLAIISSIYQSLELDAIYYPKDAANYGKDAIFVKSSHDEKWQAIITELNDDDKGINVKIFSTVKGSEVMTVIFPSPCDFVSYSRQIESSIRAILGGISEHLANL